MYRTIDCSIWSDPWFAELRTAPKLLFIYLFTNSRTTPAGTCEISARQIAFDTDIDPSEVGAALSQLSEKVAWWPDLNMVWIKNFYRRQAGNSNPENYKTSAIRALKTVPSVVREGVTHAYPELIDPSGTHGDGIPMGSPTLTRVETNRNKQEEETTKKQTTTATDAMNSSSYATTLNGALPKLESMFVAVDKQFTSVWLWGVLAEVESEVGPLARDQLGRGLDLALDEIRRSIAAGKVKSPRPFARKLIANYLTEQRDEHHAA
jgi:hypothetical protein